MAQLGQERIQRPLRHFIVNSIEAMIDGGDPLASSDVDDVVTDVNMQGTDGIDL